MKDKNAQFVNWWHVVKKIQFSSPAPPQVFQIDVESDENEE